MQVEPVAMLVRSVASSRPSSLVTSANAPPPSASSPAGSLMLQVDGRSKARSPAAVVYVVQEADAGALVVGTGVAGAEGVSVIVGVAVADAEAPDGVSSGAAAGPPHAVSSESERSSPAPGHADRRIVYVPLNALCGAGCLGERMATSVNTKATVAVTTSSIRPMK